MESDPECFNPKTFFQESKFKVQLFVGLYDRLRSGFCTGLVSSPPLPKAISPS